LSCALSRGQDAGCSCRDCGVLRAASGCCRLGCSTSQRFGTKFFAHSDSDRFAHTGLRAHTQPHSYRDSERADTYQPESDAYFYSNSDRDS
jgi:hypothetical protein